MDEDYFIRNYQPGDFPQIQMLWEETGMGGAERDDDAGTIENCIKMGGKFLVLVDRRNEGIIGTSWMTFDGRRIHLHHFAIKPECQSKGLGKYLAKESLRFIKEKGFQVKLEVHKNNYKAKSLYKNLGFFAFEDYDIFMIRNIHEIKL